MNDNTVNALIIFVDVRGFTKWASQTDVFPFIDEFGQSFQKILTDEFKYPDFFQKNLGDGALLIQELIGSITFCMGKKVFVNLHHEQ